jgi:hypothetical protein
MGEEYLSVVAVPESILVSVNSASVQELAELLRLTGAATGDGGRAMAMAVVQFRDAGGALGGGRYRSIEDLLRVPRMNRAAVDAPARLRQRCGRCRGRCPPYPRLPVPPDGTDTGGAGAARIDARAGQWRR